MYCALGNKDQAFNWLDKAFAARSSFGLMALKVDPKLDPLRADPRFPAFLRRIGLPVEDVRP